MEVHTAQVGKTKVIGVRTEYNLEAVYSLFEKGKTLSLIPRCPFLAGRKTTKATRQETEAYLNITRGTCNV